jgi:lipoprotein-anchoring transpeptidase ErfK/SrfK
MATSSKASDKPVKPAAKSAKSVAPVKAPAAKKPAAAKAPAKKAATTKAAAPAKKVAAPVAERPNAIPILTPDQRRYYVEVSAYYIAERRGFHGGSEMDDWVEAEAEIDRLVREGILKP